MFSSPVATGMREPVTYVSSERVLQVCRLEAGEQAFGGLR